MYTLRPKSRDGLRKILALLAFGQASRHDAAVYAASRLPDQFGLSWTDLIAFPTRVKSEPLMRFWRTTCTARRQRLGDLRSWKRCFIRDLPAFLRISSKQGYPLAEITSRALGELDA